MSNAEMVAEIILLAVRITEQGRYNVGTSYNPSDNVIWVYWDVAGTGKIQSMGNKFILFNGFDVNKKYAEIINDLTELEQEHAA